MSATYLISAKTVQIFVNLLHYQIMGPNNYSILFTIFHVVWATQ